MSRDSGLSSADRHRRQKVAAASVRWIAGAHVCYVIVALAMGARRGPLPLGALVTLFLAAGWVWLCMVIASRVQRGKWHAGALGAMGFMFASLMLAAGFAIWFMKDEPDSWLVWLGFLACIAAYAACCVVSGVLLLRAWQAVMDEHQRASRSDDEQGLPMP